MSHVTQPALYDYLPGVLQGHAPACGHKLAYFLYKLATISCTNWPIPCTNWPQAPVQTGRLPVQTGHKLQYELAYLLYKLAYFLYKLAYFLYKLATSYCANWPTSCAN
jgi:hypothetical protein